MRAVVQRVSKASVRVEGKTVGSISSGLMVLLGVAADDTEKDAEFLAEKVIGLRIFEDDDGKMNLSVQEASGGILVVSQFTLLGDVRKGKRPSFASAADPTSGCQLYEYFIDTLTDRGVVIQKGQFRAMMDVELVNQGPVTILLDSKKLF